MPWRRALRRSPPGKATQLTESEQKARAQYGDFWRVVTTLDEALELFAPGR